MTHSSLSLLPPIVNTYIQSAMMLPLKNPFFGIFRTKKKILISEKAVQGGGLVEEYLLFNICYECQAGLYALLLWTMVAVLQSS